MLLNILVVDFLFWGVVAILIARRSGDALHYGVVFSLLFAITYPLKFIASYYGVAVMNVKQIEPHFWYQSILLFNLAGFLFVFPALFFRKTGMVISGVEKRNDAWTILLLTGVLLIGFSYGQGALGAVFSFSKSALQERIVERVDERVGAGLSAVVRDVGLCVTLIFVWRLARVWDVVPWLKRVGVVSAMLLASFFLLAVSGSKYQALYMFFAFVVLLNLQRISTQGRGFGFSRVILGGLGGVGLVGVAGYIRGFGAISDPYQMGVVYQTFRQLTNAFDAPDNLTVILSRVETIMFGELEFAPTIHYLTGWVPRAIWPDKPLVRGNQYIMERYMPERFNGFSGEVISPSLPGELILSGGVLYMVVIVFILGIAMNHLYRQACHTGGDWKYQVVYVWFVANIFNFLRSGTGVVGAFIMFYAAFLLVWASARILSDASAAGVVKDTA